VLCFQYREDAEKVLQVLPKRFARYGLTLHPEKTRLVAFGRAALARAIRAETKTDTFDSLGYVFFPFVFSRGVKAALAPKEDRG
jgi:RNA-directed DNA polymerase